MLRSLRRKRSLLRSGLRKEAKLAKKRARKEAKLAEKRARKEAKLAKKRARKEANRAEKETNKETDILSALRPISCKVQNPDSPDGEWIEKPIHAVLDIRHFRFPYNALLVQTDGSEQHLVGIPNIEFEWCDVSSVTSTRNGWLYEWVDPDKISSLLPVPPEVFEIVSEDAIIEQMKKYTKPPDVPKTEVARKIEEHGLVVVPKVIPEALCDELKKRAAQRIINQKPSRIFNPDEKRIQVHLAGTKKDDLWLKLGKNELYEKGVFARIANFVRRNLSTHNLPRQPVYLKSMRSANGETCARQHVHRDYNGDICGYFRERENAYAYGLIVALENDTRFIAWPASHKYGDSSSSSSSSSGEVCKTLPQVMKKEATQLRINKGRYHRIYGHSCACGCWLRRGKHEDALLHRQLGT